MEELKAGAKTSEFWVTLSPVLLALVESRNENNDPEMVKTLILAGAILGGLYIISRTVVKWKCASKTEE